VGGWNEAPARVARRPAPVAKAAVGKAGPMTRQERTAPGLIVAPPVQLSAYRRLRYLVDLSSGGGVPTQRRAEPGGQVLPFRGRGGAI